MYEYGSQVLGYTLGICKLIQTIFFPLLLKVLLGGICGGDDLSILYVVLANIKKRTV